MHGILIYRGLTWQSEIAFGDVAKGHIWLSRFDEGCSGGSWKQWLGSAYKVAMASGLSLDLRRFGRLRNPNILTPLAYHYRKEEKGFFTEYMPKRSLLYVLHGYGCPGLCITGSATAAVAEVGRVDASCSTFFLVHS
ncbi:hypothetical protein VNO80_19364 [Phaseolus coccineus]|uniref:Uncharacterized protein n=1 Tax=Phaseolus coccineus TaxID=3886 RepID=A0AAN9MFI1_PHACN